MLRPFHEKTAWLNPTAGLARVEGTARHWLRGTRWTPRTSSAAKAQVSARSRSRSTTSRGDADAGRVDAQQAVHRDAELGLTLQVHQPDEDPVRAVRDPVDGPGRGDLGDGPGAEGQPFGAEPEDQEADPLALGDDAAILQVAVTLRVAVRPQAVGVGQPSGPLGEVAFGRGAVEEGPRGRGEDRAVPAVDERASAPGSSGRR